MDKQVDMSRRLAELLEPEPPNKLRGPDSAKRFWMRCGVWEQGFRPSSHWAPIRFDDNAMRRVREELKRRGLDHEFTYVLCKRLAAGQPFSTVTFWMMVNVSVADQIEAAVEVLEAEKR